MIVVIFFYRKITLDKEYGLSFEMMMSDREQLKEVTVLYSKTVKTVVLWVGVGVEYSENFLRKSR